MINRVLIRMKVVQLLYSYLLTKSDYKIDEAPVNPTRDRAYAYDVYMSLLGCILRLGGLNSEESSVRIPYNQRFAQSKLMRALAANDEIRMAMRRCGEKDFGPVLPVVYDAIISSELYKKYQRARTRDLQSDVAFWVAALNTLVLPNEDFVAAARKNPGFTMNGLEEGVRDVVRTLTEFNDNKSSLTGARNALSASLEKAYQLYHALLRLPVEIARRYELRLDEARNKYLPDEKDMNPDTRLVDGPIVELLRANASMSEYADAHPGEWDSDDVLVDHLTDKILASDIYDRYSRVAAPTLREDAEFWREVMRLVILPDDDLAEVLENKSVYWNDDLEIMGTFVVKSLRRLGDANQADKAVLPMYKDDEDGRFGPDLFNNVVEHYEEYRELIDRFIDEAQWDTERLAFMDVVIMATAIAEIVSYPSIPIPVSLNEYIEIANHYSTPKSGKFINGVLYSVITHLKNEGKLLRN